MWQVLKVGNLILRRFARSQTLERLKTQILLPTLSTSTCEANTFHSHLSHAKPCPASSILLHTSGEWIRGQPFSSTAKMLMGKKFDVKNLERYNIYDPSGNFILSSEIYYVEKFCEHYKKYTMSKMDGSISDKADPGLQSVQIVEKPGKDRQERVKLVKIKSTDAPWVIEKIKQVLLLHGAVNLDIHGKQAKPVRQMLDKEWICKVCTINSVQEEERRILLRISMPETIDSTHFKQIFTEFTVRDSTYLNQMKELLKNTKEEAK